MRTLFSLLLLIALLAGCVAPQATAPGTAEGDAAADAPAADVVTLRVLDSFTAPGKNEAVDRLNEMFMARNPDIQIEREAMTPDDMRPVIQTTLAANEGPDVIYYDTGPGFAGVLARAGLLHPLDEYYAQFGWDERIFPWTKERTRFDGNVYGIGNELEFLGAYYNENLFAELGIEPPQTYEDLLTLCQVARDNDLVAIAFGDQEKWPAYHAFSMVTNNLLGKEGMDEVLFGEGRWDSPEIVEAIRIWFEEMNEAGCFVDQPTAVGYDDANTLFYTGQALMLFTGTWLISTVLENVTFDVGWLFFPSIDGSEVLPPAGLGSGYFVSANTANPDAAARYLDFLFSEEAAQVWMEEGNVVLPMDVNTEDYDLPELLQFAVEALAQQEMGYNIDVLTPDNFNTVMADGFQAVLLGEKSAEEQAADLQAAWEQAIEEGRIVR